MAELKTKPTNASVLAFLKSVPEPERRKDGLALNQMFTEITGQKPRMWGTSIVGYGKYHYKSERSSQEGDWPLAAFSPRKQSLSLYLYAGQLPKKLFQGLGPHSTSKSCLYIKRLSDVNVPVLKRLIRASYQHARRTFGT